MRAAVSAEIGSFHFVAFEAESRAPEGVPAFKSAQDQALYLPLPSAGEPMAAHPVSTVRSTMRLFRGEDSLPKC